jgi:hypothetical protein
MGNSVLSRLACAIGVFFVTAALAQATNYTSVEATPGKPVQLTYHASAHKNCSEFALRSLRRTVS